MPNNVVKFSGLSVSADRLLPVRKIPSSFTRIVYTVNCVDNPYTIVKKKVIARSKKMVQLYTYPYEKKWVVVLLFECGVDATMFFLHGDMDELQGK